MGALKVRVGGAWVTIPGYGNTVGVPLGGVLGDVLIKNSAVAGDARWGTNPPKLNLTSTVFAAINDDAVPLILGDIAAFNTVGYQAGFQARNAGAATILRLNYFGGQVIVGGAGADQWANTLSISDSAHATSRRAGLGLGTGWVIGQDYGAIGTKDFYIFQTVNSRVALSISADGLTTSVARDLRIGGTAGPVLASTGSFLQIIGKNDIYLDADTLYCRPANGGTVRMQLTASALSVSTQVVVPKTSASYFWTDAQFLSYPQASANDQSRIALHSPGVAPQVCAAGANGEVVKIVNNPLTAFVPILASAFTVNSTITSKRGVRLLHEREHVPVSLDPRADEVQEIDVMSLRPVAFRPLVPAMRIIPLDGDDEYTLERNQSVPEIGILGHEGVRERLGLVAEHVETVLPSAVSHDRDGNCTGIDYAQITVALLDHVQRLTNRIEELERVT